MILDETRERFIKAIVAQVDVSRIAEIHFFSPIKQGGVESGVAVIAAAALQQPAEPEVEKEVEPAVEEESATPEDPVVSEEESPYADAVSEATEEPSEEATGFDAEPTEAAPTPIERHVIYTARYRLTLKGPDRGKWETNVTAEADAPIITVDAVVRGVQRRSGDVDDPTRMNGEEVRAALPKAG